VVGILVFSRDSGSFPWVGANTWNATTASSSATWTHTQADHPLESHPAHQGMTVGVGKATRKQTLVTQQSAKDTETAAKDMLVMRLVMFSNTWSSPNGDVF